MLYCSSSAKDAILERHKTIILIVVSQAAEAARAILEQTGIIQVYKTNVYHHSYS